MKKNKQRNFTCEPENFSTQQRILAAVCFAFATSGIFHSSKWVFKTQHQILICRKKDFSIFFGGGLLIRPALVPTPVTTHQPSTNHLLWDTGWFQHHCRASGGKWSPLGPNPTWQCQFLFFQNWELKIPKCISPCAAVCPSVQPCRTARRISEGRHWIRKESHYETRHKAPLRMTVSHIWLGTNAICTGSWIMVFVFN